MTQIELSTDQVVTGYFQGASFNLESGDMSGQDLLVVAWPSGDGGLMIVTDYDNESVPLLADGVMCCGGDTVHGHTTTTAGTVSVTLKLVNGEYQALLESNGGAPQLTPLSGRTSLREFVFEKGGLASRIGCNSNSTFDRLTDPSPPPT
jgi:hypothetical protein